MIAFGVLEHTPNFDGSEIVSDLVSRALTKSENERTILWVESLGTKIEGVTDMHSTNSAVIGKL